MSLSPFIYHGILSPPEEVPRDVDKVIIDDGTEAIQAKAFSECAAIESIIIPTSVRSIDNHAFERCTSLKSIVIPDSVVFIGVGAFYGCTSLTSIEIPKSITVLPPYAFHGCMALTHVSIPESVTALGRNVFFRCTSLESITLPSAITAIPDLAFSECISLTSIEIPDSVNIIGWGAFSRCFSLPSIVLPESITQITWGAFAECTALTSLVIPSSVTVMEDYAFEGCTALTSVILQRGVVTIGDSTFAECTSLTSISIPDTVHTMGQRVWEGCTSLTSVRIPQSIVKIPEHAFEGCTSLVTATLAEGIKHIGYRSFQGCTALALITIPESVKSVGNQAFDACPLLELGASAHASDVGTWLKPGAAVPPRTDIATWLRDRFHHLPLHHLLLLCYLPNVTIDTITTCIQSNPDSIKGLDSLGLSALHVLFMNDDVTTEMVELLLNANPDLSQDVGLLGRYPLHYAAMKGGDLSLSVFQTLSNSYTKDGRLVLTVRDEHHCLPCDLAIQYHKSDEIILHLFERHPIKDSNLTSQEERDKLDSIKCQYITKLSEQSVESIKSMDALQRHGWVSFVAGAEDGSDIARQCIHFINNADIQIVEMLAYFEDLSGRLTLINAVNEIKMAIEMRLFIFGRYELLPQRIPPLHKSPTCIVMKLIDRRAGDVYRQEFDSVLHDESSTEPSRSIGENGFRTLLHRLGHTLDESLFRKTFDRWKSDQDSRISETKFIEFCKNTFNNGPSHEVVVKLMTDTAQFRREIDFRERLNFDSKYVVCVNNHYSYDTHGTIFTNGLQLLSDEGCIDVRNFQHAIVMPLADQNLDSIVRNERPPPNEVRILAKQLAEAIAHVHSKGIIHGDLKLQHVVRFGDRLRLVDLGAAVEIGSFVGNKFSSGILPPEMIAKLSMIECGSFKNYFKDFRRTDPVGWVKIDPKRVGATAFYAVKTYLQREVISILDHAENGDEADTTMENTASSHGTYVYEPVVDRPLPYHLVKASETIDVWSFGVMLFSMLTGSSLFDVDRDDDLKSGQAMKELYEWNESQRVTKLKNVSDPLAHRLLRKVLSRKPSDRYQSIEEMLQDDYFSDGYTADSLYDNTGIADEAISRVTVDLRQARTDIIALIRNSVSVALTSRLDGIEVKSPTCFVILPYTTPPYCGSESALESGGKGSDSAKAFGYIEYVLDTILSCIDSPGDFTAKYVTSAYVDTTMYLFLVDESTGQSICVDEVYPLEVDVQSMDVQAFLPLMAVVIRVLATTKGVAGIMRLFLPGMPRDEIPANLWAKVSCFVEECTKATSTTSIGVWGNELRLLGTFLVDQDAHCTFSDLRRIRDSSSGTSMWAVKELAETQGTVISDKDLTWRETFQHDNTGCCSIS